MKYLCLVYREEKKPDAMSRPEFAAFVAEHRAYDKVLRKSGYGIAAEGLQPVRTATTVRMRNGKVTTTDGPFAETKEQLGVFFLINAQNLDEAILVASKIPAARLGSIEIRPIRESEQP
ncbi:MAG: YciI family protein [Candidatus Rokuibacteriota bacterium]